MKICVIACVVVALAGCTRRHDRSVGTIARDSIVMSDVLGTRVAVPRPPERIISLAPNLTEILFAIGAQDRLVGVTRFCTYPEAAQSIAKVGDLQTPNYELLAAMRPEIVFMSYSGNMPQAYEKLRAMGIRVFLTPSRTIEEVEMTIRTVAQLTGRDSIGNALADRVCSRIDSLSAVSRNRRPVDAVILLTVNPLVAVGNGFLNEALRVAGGRNVAENATIAYPQINREALVARAPHIIFIPSDVVEPTEEIWRLFPEWKSLRKSGTRIVRIDADPLMRPGPRIVEGIEAMAAELRRNDE